MKISDLKIWKMDKPESGNIRREVELFILDTIRKNNITHLPSQRVFAEINNLHPSLVKRAYSNLVARQFLITKRCAATMVAEATHFIGRYYPESPFNEDLPRALDSPYIVNKNSAQLIHNFQSIGLDRLSDAYFPQVLNKYLRFHRNRYKTITQAEQMRDYAGTVYKETIRKHLNTHSGFQINDGCINISICRSVSLGKIFNIILREGDGFVNTAPQDILLSSVLESRGLKQYDMMISDEDFITNLEKYVIENPIKAIYINSQCTYPESNYLQPEIASKLISLAKRYRFFIVEENDFHEFWYTRDFGFRPLAKQDHQGHVIYTAPLSQSSVYMYNTRVILAHQDIISLMSDRPGHQDHRSMIEEQAIIDFIENGKLWDHAEYIRNAKEKDMEALYWELDNYLGPWIKVNKPDSGLCFWLAFPSEVDIKKAMDYLQNYQIEVPYNHVTYVATDKVFRMRLSFGIFNILEAQAAAKLLKQMFEDLKIPKRF